MKNSSTIFSAQNSSLEKKVKMLFHQKLMENLNILFDKT